MEQNHRRLADLDVFHLVDFFRIISFRVAPLGTFRFGMFALERFPLGVTGRLGWKVFQVAPGKTTSYDDLARQIDGLLACETDFTANLANAAAAIYHALHSLNWAGFYLYRDGMLVLGPFQGKPACVRIPIGTGVCGIAALRRQSILVPDVHAFAGHIACDAASRSELVVPLIRDTSLIGVLDLDSPLPARFDARDLTGCEAVAAVVVRHLTL